MLPAIHSENLPHLVRALKALSLRDDHQHAAQDLIHELSGITAMVAQRFTNDRTAEGLQEAFRLTIGCVSLGLSEEKSGDGSDDAIDYLILHGAEQAFQTGFRLIRELDKLPADAMLFDFEKDQAAQQARQKLLFKKICMADPTRNWAGHQLCETERKLRQTNQKIVDCAKWLRQHHYAGPVKEADLDAEGVIAVAIIFAIEGGGKIVARAGQKDFESLIKTVRQNNVEFESAWADFLSAIPAAHRPIIQERIAIYCDTRHSLFKKIRAKANMSTLFKEFLKYAGDALEVDYD